MLDSDFEGLKEFGCILFVSGDPCLERHLFLLDVEYCVLDSIGEVQDLIDAPIEMKQLQHLFVRGGHLYFLFLRRLYLVKRFSLCVF